MPDINSMAPGSGRRLRENNTVVNTAEMIEALYNALVVNKNAGVQLTGSIVLETKNASSFYNTYTAVELENGEVWYSDVFDLQGGKPRTIYYQTFATFAANFTHMFSDDGINWITGSSAAINTSTGNSASQVAVFRYYKMSIANSTTVNTVNVALTANQ